MRSTDGCKICLAWGNSPYDMGHIAALHLCLALSDWYASYQTDSPTSLAGCHHRSGASVAVNTIYRLGLWLAVSAVIDWPVNAESVSSVAACLVWCHSITSTMIMHELDAKHEL